MTLKTDAYQIGLDSTTDTNNFLLQTNGAGNLHIHKGSSGTGTVVFRVKSDNTVEIPNGLIGGLTSGTVQNTTSGTSIDFTGIPSWAKRITVMLNGVSTSGSNGFRVQIGSGAVETAGYAGNYGVVASANVTATGTLVGAGFDSYSILATGSYHGQITLINISGNVWSFAMNISSNEPRMFLGTGSKTTSGAVDRLRFTTIGSTDTFDAGSVNIMYEG